MRTNQKPILTPVQIVASYLAMVMAPLPALVIWMGDQPVTLKIYATMVLLVLAASNWRIIQVHEKTT